MNAVGVIVDESPLYQESFLNEERNISIEQGFNICLFFFNYLWPSTEPKLAKLDDEESTVNQLFFLHTCIGFECSAQWIQAVYLATKIPKEEQKKGFKLTEKEVFFSTLEFNKIYNKVFHFKLIYVLNLLESMLTHSMDYYFEWSTWEGAVDYSFKTTDFVHLNWDAKFLQGE